MEERYYSICNLKEDFNSPWKLCKDQTSYIVHIGKTKAITLKQRPNTHI